MHSKRSWRQQPKGQRRSASPSASRDSLCWLQLPSDRGTFVRMPSTSRSACAVITLFAPFRSGTTHIMLLRAVFPDRAVPGWTQKRQQRADGGAQKGNKNRSGERKLSHVMLHGKNCTRTAGRVWTVSILANAGSTGISRHPIIVGPVEANAAKLELALHATQLGIGDGLDHVLQEASHGAR